MNKYDSIDAVVNSRNSNVAPMNYSPDQISMIYPGTAGLNNQRISALPPHIPSPYPQVISYRQVQPSVIPHYPVNNQVYSSFNQYPIQNNILQSMVPHQHIYHGGLEKMNHTSPSFMYQPHFSMFRPQNPQIHQMTHVQAQVTPQITLQQSHMQSPQIPLQYSQVSRTLVPTVNEKPGKTSCALEIINPETNKLIDLTCFKSDQEIKKNKNESLELKNDKENHSNQTKGITVFQINKAEGLIDVKDLSMKNSNDGKEQVTECKEKVKHCAMFPDKKENALNNFDGMEESENNIETFSKSLNETCYISPTHLGSQDLEIPSELSLLNSTSSYIINSDINIALSHDLSPVKDMEVVQSEKNLNKYIYSRDDLIKIGKHPLSHQKPKGLLLRDFTDPIILENSINLSYFDNIENMQSNYQKSLKVHKGSQGNAYSWRPANIKNASNIPKCINLGNTDNILPRSDDGYITFKQRLAAGEEFNETEELVRQIKGILNRIVPQNFDQCLDDLVLLKIGTHEGMTCLVNELFLKAVKEEAYSVTFAKICSYLASIRADVSDHEVVTFRSVLLQKCQAMFTTPLEEQLETVRQDWLLKASNEKPKTKALMESDVDEQIKKAKDRYYGNIRFIGELYLKGVLITKIICFCLENLLTKENDPDSLICLCKLLETCGAKLESDPKGRVMLNESCKKLLLLTTNTTIETRVRFRILDIIEMRENSWNLRKVQQDQKIQPKTLEEMKIEKEMEDEKDHVSNINRKTVNQVWSSDRRPSLPNVNKSRAGILPKQLTLGSNSYDVTTLGPSKRNWVAGSGAAISSYVSEPEKKINKPKGKLNFELRQRDFVYTYENSDHNQSVEGCVTILENYNLSTLSFPNQSTNSSENSSRSSSHGRSTPQIIFKDKLPDSKLAQSDTTILSPVELLKEYVSTNFFCEDSWKAYSDKVEVVHGWLDSHFDTDCDKRITLSQTLCRLINQNFMDKCVLIKAFTKLIGFLDELIIDIGSHMWDGLSDYFRPFLENMEMDSLELIENVFNFENSKGFDGKITSQFYTLPWSMTNQILKCSHENVRDVFRLTLSPENAESLSYPEHKLISIVSTNLSRAINIVTQISTDFYSLWIKEHYAESFNYSSQQFFFILNWDILLNQIAKKPMEQPRLTEYLRILSVYSDNNEMLIALCKICTSLSEEEIKSIVSLLIKTDADDLQKILSWEYNSHSFHIPPKLRDVLNIHSAFKSNFSSANSGESNNNNNSFNQSLDHDNNCTDNDD